MNIGFYRKEGWVFYYRFIGWWHWSLGLSFYLPAPNVELHLPFGFIRVGKQDPWMIINGEKV